MGGPRSETHCRSTGQSCWLRGFLLHNAFSKVLGLHIPQIMITFVGSLQAVGIGHTYGLFGTIRAERLELVIEASPNGSCWEPLEPRYGPGGSNTLLRAWVP